LENSVRRDGTLQHYRAYKLNAGGRIVSGEWIEAASDEAARELAHAMCDDTTPSVELWQGARRIAVLPCKDEAAA
jgi:hypothetical protein